MVRPLDRSNFFVVRKISAPTAYTLTGPSVSPASTSFCGKEVSADRKTWKGAPFMSCVTSAPDAPKVNSARYAGYSLAKDSLNAGATELIFAAAAMETFSCAAAAERQRTRPRHMTIAFRTLTSKAMIIRRRRGEKTGRDVLASIARRQRKARTRGIACL